MYKVKRWNKENAYYVFSTKDEALSYCEDFDIPYSEIIKLDYDCADFHPRKRVKLF
jgi:hypothetical protein